MKMEQRLMISDFFEYHEKQQDNEGNFSVLGLSDLRNDLYFRQLLTETKLTFAEFIGKLKKMETSIQVPYILIDAMRNLGYIAPFARYTLEDIYKAGIPNLCELIADKTSPFAWLEIYEDILSIIETADFFAYAKACKAYEQETQRNNLYLPEETMTAFVARVKLNLENTIEIAESSPSKTAKSQFFSVSYKDKKLMVSFLIEEFSNE